MCVDHLFHARHFKDTTSPNPQIISVRQAPNSVILQARKLRLRKDLLKRTQLVCVLVCMGWGAGILSFSASSLLKPPQLMESSMWCRMLGAQFPY